jgi:hypothetical protein
MTTLLIIGGGGALVTILLYALFVMAKLRGNFFADKLYGAAGLCGAISTLAMIFLYVIFLQDVIQHPNQVRVEKQLCAPIDSVQKNDRVKVRH